MNSLARVENLSSWRVEDGSFYMRYYATFISNLFGGSHQKYCALTVVVETERANIDCLCPPGNPKAWTPLKSSITLNTTEFFREYLTFCCSICPSRSLSSWEWRLEVCLPIYFSFEYQLSGGKTGLCARMQ